MPTIPAAPSPDFIALAGDFATHNWYAVAAIVLMLLIQIARVKEAALWTKTPSGWRWLWPVGLSMVTAFVHAFVVGEALKQAGLDVLNSLWQIALPAMGGAAALKESPLPWDGGPGGAPKLAARKAGALAEKASLRPGAPDLHVVTQDDRPTPVDPGTRPPPPSTPPAA
jgi:uncharacterized integral membrane protein